MNTPTRRFAAAILLLALAACGDESGGTPNASATPAEATPASNDEAQAPQLDREALKAKGYAIGDVVLGDANAPVTLVEYASITCPACQRFHTTTLPSIKRDYINSGKVKLIVRDVIGSRIGLYAIGLARCSGDDRYYPYLDELFRRQSNFRTQDSQANLAELRRIAKIGGMSNEKFDSCLNDNPFLNALYQDAIKHTEVLNKNDAGTPFLVVQPGDDQKTFRGAVGPEQLSEAIDSFLK